MPFILLLILLFPFRAFGAEILFAGDVTLARNISPSQKTFFTERARKRIEAADLFIWNMEGSGKSLTPKEKRFVFSSDTDNVSGMRFKNGLATIANNHSLDGGVEGLRNLLSSLKKHGVPAVGRLKDGPLKATTGGKTYYIFNFTPMARSGHPEWEIADFDAVSRDLKRVRGKGVIIVNIHDGVEGTKNISPRQKEYVRRLSSLGADIINFTHSHTYIDPGLVGKTLVLWGTGNFIFGGNSAWRNRDDVRMLSVNPETKTWKWVKGKTRGYVFDL